MQKISCLYQDEVASAHWKTNSVTLFIVRIWFQKESISMVIVSDNKHHDKRTVVPYLCTVFNYVKEMFRENIQNINIWIDDPISQFKNKFTFSYIGHNLPHFFPHYHMTWNYSSTSHGKGAVDGIGGTIKQLATRAIISRRAVTKDAKSLEEAVSQQTSIQLKLISEDEIEHPLKQTNARIYWDDLLAVLGTIHEHFVAPNPISIETKVTTNDDKSTVHSLTNSSIVPQSLIPNPKS